MSGLGPGRHAGGAAVTGRRRMPLNDRQLITGHPVGNYTHDFRPLSTFRLFMNARDATQPQTLVNQLYAQMTLPVICSPMFIVSNPKLVVAQFASGVMCSFPALNARPQALLYDSSETHTSELPSLMRNT